ncbi:hypothetical protein C4561_00590 [candidate division WWE3 bacterium]|jgi:predicted glycosyl hydrolase (DUF1957 family)|uniref:Glycoside hydrolase family 57 N-terminal domain-containing protein n=1 Tax=candidate division WWE3 bacterium TaxID=2053526 RepID=A0A3A4ZG52_UNCKA|nr:MAG: hypothetical protein C4561_00590 [candidate division WWE3 bacterium]
MNLAFVLHLYQPPTQSESALKTIVAESYIPLLKLIKNKSDTSFTLNVPLSVLELLDKYGYTEVINTIKDLVELEKIELTGSGAYHPLLTKISEKNVYQQIILNEYGQGYYFGARQGFEGENSILIKNLKGFFPPELCINMKLIDILNDLDYEWVLIDSSALDENSEGSIFKVGGHKINLVKRDTDLSNILAFKRDAVIDDIVKYVMNLRTEAAVIALDAETFGHHNKDGIYLLDLLIDKLHQINVKIINISTLVSQTESKDINTVLESTWAFEKGGIHMDIYRLWDIQGNKFHEILWKMLHIVDNYNPDMTVKVLEEGYETISIWNQEDVKSIQNKQLVEDINLNLLILKSMHSDQFWWASNMTIYDKHLFSPLMIENSVNMYRKIAPMLNNENLFNEITALCDEVSLLLKS